METRAKIEHGPLEIEVHAFEDEDYQEEVIDIIEFIEENKAVIEELEGEISRSGMKDSGTEDTSLEAFTESNGDESESEEQIEAGPLSEVASELRVSERELEEFLFVDSEGEDPPVMYVDEVGEVGDRKTDRQRVVSLILLYLWHRCYDVDRVKSTNLKDALALSNVSSSGMGNMYQGEGDRYFNRKGRGPSATVRLTPPGKRQARKELKRLLEGDDSE